MTILRDRDFVRGRAVSRFWARGWAILALAAPLFIIGSGVAGTELKRLPETLWWQDRIQPPAWVAAESALDAKGALLEAAPVRVPSEHFANELSDAELAWFRTDRSAAAEELCRTTSLLFDHDWKALVPGGSLDNLASHAAEILWLRVEGMEPGFAYGMPQTMLRARVQEVVHGSLDHLEGSQVLVLYRHATFLVGRTLWCNLDARYNLRPAVGDDLLLFTMAPPPRIDPGGIPLFVPYWHELILGRPDGSIE